MFDILIVALVIFLFTLPGCSHSILAKECKQVQGEDTYKCKNLKPWE